MRCFYTVHVIILWALYGYSSLHRRLGLHRGFSKAFLIG